MAEDGLRPPPWLLTVALFVFLVGAAMGVAGTRPPSPQPEDAPVERFSGMRDQATLSRILEAGVAHPTGSPANQAVRERIVAELRDLGYAPELQKATSCSRFGSCGHVTNILARGGRPGGRAVLLVAHYDSVPAGMGAADDGMGIAVLLEVARALAMTPALAGPVLFLFTDGEEAGLLGAEAFVKSHPARQEVGVVVNVEARGSRGASLMFETSDGGAWLVRAFSRASKRPLTSSLFYAVYRRMPNDTDLTVFKRVGLPGINLANVGGVEHYHTPLDDLSNLSHATLQHHGDSALGLVRELAGKPELDSPPKSEAVFFDVFGRFVVSWPIGWTPLVVGLGLLTWCGALVLAARARVIRVRAFVTAVLRWPLSVALATAIALGAFSLLRARGLLPTPWPAYSSFGVLVQWGAVLIGVSLPLAFQRTEDAWAEWAAVFCWWAVLTAILMRALPEAVFLTLIPVALAGVFGCVAFLTRREWARVVALLAPVFGAALLFIPVLALSRDTLGLALAEAATAAGALALTTLLPVLSNTLLSARRTLLISSLVLFATVLGGALIAPVYTEASPQRMSIALHQDSDQKRARWLVDASGGPVPMSVRDAAGLDPALVDPEPWFGGWGPEALSGPAPDPNLPAPEWTSKSDGSEKDARVIRASIRSRREAPMLTLHFPPETEILELRVAGVLTAPRQRGRSKVTVFTGAGADGVEVEMTVRSRGHATLSDHSFELPPSGAKIQDARPRSAVRSQFGDTTVVSRRVDW
jgi:hypothetical protein